RCRAARAGSPRPHRGRASTATRSWLRSAIPSRTSRRCANDRSYEGTAMTTNDRLITEKEGAIGWITFNNPERLNAVSLDMWEGMETSLSDFLADDAIRVIVLKGAGEKAFVAGAD